MRPTAAEHAPRPIVTAQRIPLTGGSEHRVSGRVRSIAWALEERAEPVEVECFRDDASEGSEPGVMLLDRRFPIFLAVLEDEVYILVNCELLAGPVRARLAAVRTYVDYFAANGYAMLYDHDAASRQPVERVLPQLPGMLAATGTSSQLASLAWDFRIGFLLVVPVFIGLGRLFRWNDPEPWSLTLTRAVVLGAVSSWMQYRQMRSMLAGRVAAVKQSLLLPDDRALAGGETGNQPQIFLPLPPSKGDLAGAAFILLLLVMAIASQVHAVVVAIFLAILIGGTAWTYWLSLSHVVFDADGVEGRGLTGRVRLSYADVETMREAIFGDTLRVSGRGRTFWMPHRLRDYGAAVAQLEERVERARMAAAVRARDDEDTGE